MISIDDVLNYAERLMLERHGVSIRSNQIKVLAEALVCKINEELEKLKPKSLTVDDLRNIDLYVKEIKTPQRATLEDFKKLEVLRKKIDGFNTERKEIMKKYNGFKQCHVYTEKSCDHKCVHCKHYF